MALDPISAIGTLVDTIVGKIFPDANKKLDVQQAKDAAKAALESMQLSGELQQIIGQLQINAEEAKSSSVFIAGWRPFIGWICGSAFAWSYVVGPMFYWISSQLGHATPIPSLSLNEMMPVLLGMLGLGGLRTYEKMTNTEGNR